MWIKFLIQIVIISTLTIIVVELIIKIIIYCDWIKMKLINNLLLYWQDSIVLDQLIQNNKENNLIIKIIRCLGVLIKVWKILKKIVCQLLRLSYFYFFMVK